MSRGQVAWKMCKRKRRYWSSREATKALFGPDLHVYQCPFSSKRPHWHIGHVKTQGGVS